MDGHHIPDAVFRTIFLAKTENQMILVSDASSLAGLPPGFYQQWGHDVELTSDGKLVVVGTTYLAGSVSFLDHCVANAAAALRSEFGMPIAVDMASSQPRRLLGLPPHRDYPDSPAGFVIFHYVRDGAIDIHQVFAPNANHPANLGD
jgi:N-acetylglucosamine-6-phosphate deacetylase